MILHSPESGILYPPRTRRVASSSEFQQRFWQGSPLDRENRFTWLEEQTLLGWVGSSDRFRAAVYVPQQEIEFVATKAEVRLTFNSQPASPLSGSIERISSHPETDSPPELTATGVLALSQSDGLLADTRFVAYVRLDSSPNAVPPLYSTGFARIACRRTSLASRCWRLLSHTFAFEM